MENNERQLVLEELLASEAMIVGLVDALTPAQWSFRENPERWSIAEITEHLVVFEAFVLATIARVTKAPAQPDKKTDSAKDGLVLGLAGSRNVTFMAREAARPIGRWTDPADLIREFRQARARTLTFAEETDIELRVYFFPHIVWGDLDCYQWLLLLARHCLRHALQIEEIMADARYLQP